MDVSSRLLCCAHCLPCFMPANAFASSPDAQACCKLILPAVMRDWTMHLDQHSFAHRRRHVRGRRQTGRQKSSAPAQAAHCQALLHPQAAAAALLKMLVNFCMKKSPHRLTAVQYLLLPGQGTFGLFLSRLTPIVMTVTAGALKVCHVAWKPLHLASDINLYI